MAFEEGTGNGMYMPVAPAYGGNGGFMGGDGWWMIIVLLLCGWGNGFGGGFGGGYGNMQLSYDFPWLLQGQNAINANTNSGFDHAATQSAIGDLQGAVTSGFGDVATQLCGGFAGVNATTNGAQNALAQQLYSNEIASLNRSFAEQTANTQGFFGVQSGIADLRYTEATEGCATRNAASQNTQTIITALNAGVQSIKDQLYADKLSSKDDIIAQLRQENLFARGQASQIAQDTRIIDGVYNRLSQCPVDTTPVFGRQPIFTCPTNVGGCGNATGFVG